jgi:hypothetical protein
VAARLATELEGETVLRGPESGAYRGATVPGYSVVQNSGLIVQTAEGEVGFFVGDHLGFLAALSPVIPGRQV